MVKIKALADCGNAPKNTFIQNFNIAFAQGDAATVSAMVTDDIIWEMVGMKTICGKPDLVKMIEKMKNQEIEEYTITSAISHGKTASASGEMRMRNGLSYAFADIYEFSSVKGNEIRMIKSYLIEL